MVEDRTVASRSTPRPSDGAPGISWEAGEEDYPFPSRPGETALEYLQRWIAEAGYARIERDGVRYIHEVDVANVVNNLTADVDLLQARLDPFGDHVFTAEEYDLTVGRLERAVIELRAALATMRDQRG